MQASHVKRFLFMGETEVRLLRTEEIQNQMINKAGVCHLSENIVFRVAKNMYTLQLYTAKYEVKIE